MQIPLMTWQRTRITYAVVASGFFATSTTDRLTVLPIEWAVNTTFRFSRALTVNQQGIPFYRVIWGRENLHKTFNGGAKFRKVPVAFLKIVEGETPVIRRKMEIVRIIPDHRKVLHNL